MNLAIKDNECCGCSACMNICPRNAIKMKSNTLDGFLYPTIDENKCIECKLCEEVCPFLNRNEVAGRLEKIGVYAVKNKNDEDRLRSSSGGVFTLISDYILNKNGVVYGAQYDKNLNVIHGRAENKRDRDKFRGSKYVQSNISDTYKKVKNDLIDGKKVLFTGTPCQVSGLNNYIGESKYIKNLYTQDIVCHGVPSPAIFKENLKYLEKKYNSKVKKVNFRGKVLKGNTQDLEVVFENGRVLNVLPKMDLYYSLFLHDIILRPSCYNCKFTNLKREADITLADYWGIEGVFPDFKDDKGISMVLINTKKGKELFGNIIDQIDYIETSTKQCMQKNLYEPTSKSKLHNLFWLIMEKMSFDKSIGITKMIVLMPRIKHAIKKRIKI